MEKGLDGHSDASVGQENVSRYFDSLPLLSISSFLESKGVLVSLLASILCHQFLTRVVLIYRSASRVLPPRSKCGLIGSNVALAVARVPIELTAAERALRGFDIGVGRLAFATYVDKMFLLSRTLLRMLTKTCATFSNAVRLAGNDALRIIRFPWLPRRVMIFLISILRRRFQYLTKSWS